MYLVTYTPSHKKFAGKRLFYWTKHSNGLATGNKTDEAPSAWELVCIS